MNHWMPRDAVESSIIDDVYASGDHIMDRLYKSARKAGVRWGDPHFGNAAIAGGRPKILDPGFMDSAASLGEDVAEIPRAPLGEHIRQSAVVNRLADALGYTGMVRNQWEGLPWRDPTLRNAFLAAPSAGFLNALHGQY